MEVRDPVTGPYMLGRVDGDLLRSAPASAQTVLILGDYRWDGNPYIGTWQDTVSSIIIIPLKARWPTSTCGTAPWRRRSSGRRPAAARPWRTRAASSTTGAEISLVIISTYLHISKNIYISTQVRVEVHRQAGAQYRRGGQRGAL